MLSANSKASNLCIGFVDDDEAEEKEDRDVEEEEEEEETEEKEELMLWRWIGSESRSSPKISSSLASRICENEGL